MNVIECRDLVKKYRRNQVLDHLSLTIEDHKLTGLIGKNGAGKTTLLKIMAGFIRPTSGEVKVFSKNPFNSLFVSANSIMIDDQTGFPHGLTLADILEEADRFYEHWNPELAQRLFDYFSFKPNMHHGHLSKGMKSTFNMIVGLAARCPLTIFDEPATGMDAGVRKDFYRALLKEYIAHPRTIIISSHHLEEIEDLLEDVILLKDGKVYFHLPVSELKEWAIGMQGKTPVVKKWTAGKDWLYHKEIAPGRIYVVVQNDYSDTEVHQARSEGIECSRVSATDTCVYLTRNQKGGIDDVFNRAEFI